MLLNEQKQRLVHCKPAVEESPSPGEYRRKLGGVQTGFAASLTQPQPEGKAISLTKLYLVTDLRHLGRSLNSGDDNTVPLDIRFTFYMS